MNGRRAGLRAWAWCLAGAVLMVPDGAHAMPRVKLGLYGVVMQPNSQDAEEFSRTGVGVGFHAVVPLPQLGHVLAGNIGIEGVNLLNETTTFIDRQTLLRVEQQTSQDYARFFLGPEIGGHGFGFWRPHVGVNVATIVYNISTDVVIPDDFNRENEIRQNLRSRTRTAFGYDFTAGNDFNFGVFLVEGGVKFTKSFNVPQQLGDGAVTISPGYFQYYLGVGVNLKELDRATP